MGVVWFDKIMIIDWDQIPYYINKNLFLISRFNNLKLENLAIFYK